MIINDLLVKRSKHGMYEGKCRKDADNKQSKAKNTQKKSNDEEQYYM